MEPHLLDFIIISAIFGFILVQLNPLAEFRQEKLLGQSSLYPKKFLITQNNASAAIDPVSETVTPLSYCSVYWTIPKIKNADGGWDSIDGFYDAENPPQSSLDAVY